MSEAANAGIISAAMVPADQDSRSLGRVLEQLAKDVAIIESSAALIDLGGSPLVRQVTIDLVRAQAWRASWLLRAGAILEDTYYWDFRLQLLGSALERLRQGLVAEGRLSGVDLQVSVPDWNVSADVDEQGLVAGLMGAVVATLGLVDGRHGVVITLLATASPSGLPSVDIAQDVAPVSAALARRFFDASWSDRPGGWTAAIGAATAKAVAERHGGDAVLMAGEGRGSVIRLSLGRAR